MISAKFKENDAFIFDIEVNVVPALVSDDRGETFSHEAVPVRADLGHSY